MDTVRVLKVIETTLLRRGDGKDTPVRIITQYWDMDGTLLAEIDPCMKAVWDDRWDPESRERSE